MNEVKPYFIVTSLMGLSIHSIIIIGEFSGQIALIGLVYKICHKDKK